MQTMYDALLTNMTASSTRGTDSHTAFWVASRCADSIDTTTGFEMFRVSRGDIRSVRLYNSSGTSSGDTEAVRPMVEINLDSVAIGATGSGTNTDPYSMVKQ